MERYGYRFRNYDRCNEYWDAPGTRWSKPQTQRHGCPPLNHAAARACHTVTRWAPHQGNGAKRPFSTSKTRVKHNETKEREGLRGSSLGVRLRRKTGELAKMFRLTPSRLDVDERVRRVSGPRPYARTSGQLLEGGSWSRRTCLLRAQGATGVAWDTWLPDPNSNMDALTER